MLGKRLGERRLLVRIAQQSNPARGQFCKTVGTAEHAHARPRTGFRKYRDREPGEHGGRDGVARIFGSESKKEYAEKYSK